MKLELKHLAPYLPHKVNLSDNGIVVLLSILNLQMIVDYPLLRTDHVKLILRPLSDLTEKIEIDGKKLYPDDYWDSHIDGIKIHEELWNMSLNNYCDFHFFRIIF